MDIQLARLDELPVVMEILAWAAAWLKQKGIDQWPSPPNEHWWRRMAQTIDREEVYTVGEGTNRYGIVRLIWADPYWPDDNLAGYVHSMAVRPDKHGRDIGDAILAWAASEVTKRGRSYLRLDCLASNDRLRRYYEARGFEYQSELVDHDYTAALYERSVRVG